MVENRSKGIIIGNQTLVLQKVNRHQAGLYTCVASNQEGDGESNAQYLDVKCKLFMCRKSTFFYLYEYHFLKEIRHRFLRIMNCFL